LAGATSLLEPIQVFHPAMLLPLASKLTIHNHPSGNIQPSHDDLKLTLKLAAAGKLLGIPLIDHLVVSATEYYSLKEHGVLTDYFTTDEVFDDHQSSTTVKPSFNN
jgi:DNA repair protein RadC